MNGENSNRKTEFICKYDSGHGNYTCNFQLHHSSFFQQPHVWSSRMGTMTSWHKRIESRKIKTSMENVAVNAFVTIWGFWQDKYRIGQLVKYYIRQRQTLWKWPTYKLTAALCVVSFWSSIFPYSTWILYYMSHLRTQRPPSPCDFNHCKHFSHFSCWKPAHIQAHGARRPASLRICYLWEIMTMCSSPWICLTRFYKCLVNPSSKSVFLKPFLARDPQSDMYLAADPHLRTCCSRDHHQKQRFELEKFALKNNHSRFGAIFQIFEK